MGKLTTYLIVMSGLMILFHIAGIIETGTTPHSTLVALLLNPENMPDSSFFLKIILAIEAVGIAGAVILGFLNRNVELVAVGVFVIYLINLGWDFLAVFIEIAAANRVLAILLFSPVLLVYMVTMLEFWRGRD